MPSAMAWEDNPVSDKTNPKAAAICFMRMFHSPFRVIGALYVALSRGLSVARVDCAVEDDRCQLNQAAEHAPHLTSCRRRKRNSRRRWHPQRPCTKHAADTGRAVA